jgi:ribosomal protein L40E
VTDDLTSALESLDITPDPRILIALTRTPLAPLDAICELVDNSLDAFHDARVMGQPVQHPLVQVTIPGVAEWRRGDGVVRVQDNGLGLAPEVVANAIRAGYTTKTQFDTLGLFGMGFNIATGKLGPITRLITARREDTQALEVVIDLFDIARTRTFKVPARWVPKPTNFEHGTVVEITSRWPDGDANAGFTVRLAAMSKPFIREQLGRRYATLLRSDSEPRTRILVNGESCQPFEHCVWSKERYVERQGWGRIAAKVEIDEPIHSSIRCREDGAVLADGATTCPACGGTNVRAVSERLRGWLGVQRFDDPSDFGIDLIRNGRAIRVGEKNAFFTYVDTDTRKEEKEYPIDQQTGRLVGEVHLDHVPVDFQKQDFQRSSDEWRRAMDYLRGGSLVPSRWPPDEPNKTAVSLLFQGYRKVRNFGRADMYMGRYSAVSGKADRIDRQTEQEYYQKFLAHEAGFYDDAEWWKLVETANQAPISGLLECSQCGFQHRDDEERCEECGHIFRSKQCVSCGAVLVLSAPSCDQCGASQLPDIREPWKCLVCKTVAGASEENCPTCGAVQGTPDPLSREVLLAASSHSEALSIDNLSIHLANGSAGAPVSVDVRIVGTQLRPEYNGEPVPAVTFRDPGKITVFLDETHPLYVALGMRPEIAVAIEFAQYQFELYSHLSSNKNHTLLALSEQVLRDRFLDALGETPDIVRGGVEVLFGAITDALLGNADASDYYGELEEAEQVALARGLIAAGRSLADLERMRTSGEYLRFAPRSSLVTFFRRYPDAWFGTVWTEALPSDEVAPVVASDLRAEIVTKYLRCLEDCASFVQYQHPERLLIIRTRASLDFLQAKLR